MSDGFVIEGIEDFERKLRTAPKTFPHVLEAILESLGEELLNSIQDELQKNTRPHARYQMLTRTVTRGPICNTSARHPGAALTLASCGTLFPAARPAMYGFIAARRPPLC